MHISYVAMLTDAENADYDPLTPSPTGVICLGRSPAPHVVPGSRRFSTPSLNSADVMQAVGIATSNFR